MTFCVIVHSASVTGLSNNKQENNKRHDLFHIQIATLSKRGSSRTLNAQVLWLFCPKADEAAFRQANIKVSLRTLNSSYVGLAQANILFLYLNFLLLCWLGTSQHTVPLFKLLIIIIIFSSENRGPHYSKGFEATSTKLGRYLGPDVRI